MYSQCGHRSAYIRPTACAQKPSSSPLALLSHVALEASQGRFFESRSGFVYRKKPNGNGSCLVDETVTRIVLQIAPSDLLSAI